MGYGNHDYEYIDPTTVPTDFGPPEGVARRDFNNAFNRPHEETDVDMDTISRPGTVIDTDAPGLEGKWTVVGMPRFTRGVVWAKLAREGSDSDKEVSTVELGVVAERNTNMYNDKVITKLVSGGRANKSTRAALTQRE